MNDFIKTTNLRYITESIKFLKGKLIWDIYLTRIERNIKQCAQKYEMQFNVQQRARDKREWIEKINKFKEEQNKKGKEKRVESINSTKFAICEWMECTRVLSRHSMDSAFTHIMHARLHSTQRKIWHVSGHIKSSHHTHISRENALSIITVLCVLHQSSIYRRKYKKILHAMLMTCCHIKSTDAWVSFAKRWGIIHGQFYARQRRNKNLPSLSFFYTSCHIKLAPT